MSSVQRLKEYIDSSDLEADWEKPVPSSNSWPQTGEVKGLNVKMRYRDGLPLVLNSLSFQIESKQKVGIVGRTGSGKSSLLLAIMRIVEI